MNLKGKVGRKIIGAALSATMLVTALPAAAALASEHDRIGCGFGAGSGIHYPNPNIHGPSRITAEDLANLVLEVSDFYNTYGDQLPVMDRMMLDFSIESSCHALVNEHATPRRYAEEYNMLVSLYFDAVSYIQDNDNTNTIPFFENDDNEDDEPVAPDFGMEEDEDDEPVAPDFGMEEDNDDNGFISGEDDEPVAPDFGMEDDEDDDDEFVIDHPDSFTIDGQSDEDDEPVAPDFGMEDDEDDEPVAPDFGMEDDEDDEPVAPDFGMEDDFINDIDDTDTTPSVEPVEPADDTTRIEDPIAEDTTRVEDIISDDDTTPAPAPVAPAATAPAATESAPAATTSSSSASSAPVVIVLSKEAAADLFVEQLYITVLDRASDAEGKAEWVNILLNDEDGFDKTINGFMNCAEFADRNISDDEFVEILYKVLFNRVPSDSELANWTAALKNGTSRSAVITAFLNSSECETVNEEF